MLKNLFCTTVGRKLLVGLTGIGVSGFALVHMSGNLLIFAGPQAYNTYGHQLTANAVVYAFMESILVVLFGGHLGLALYLARENRKARSVKPSSAGSGEKRASFASRTMVYSGLLLAVFLGWHLKDFRFGEVYTVVYNGVEMRDLYRLMVNQFSETGHVVFYVFSVLVLALHLSHGVSAVFQSLGLASARSCKLRKLAYGFSLLVAGGFLSQPLYIYFTGGR